VPRAWNFTTNAFKRSGGEAQRGRPGYLFGGHVRASTVALILLFLAVWWLHDTYEPAKPPAQVPATQVVPPGFVPDPNYTWVPRSRLQQPPSTVTVTQTPTMTSTTTPTPTTTTTTTTTTSTPAPPPFVLPPIFGPPTTTSTAPPSPSPAPGSPPASGPAPAPLPLP
jgi:hypothetical protein